MFSWEDYYIFIRRKKISIKDSGHVIYRFHCSDSFIREFLQSISSQWYDIKEKNLWKKPISYIYEWIVLRFKLNYTWGKLSSVNFRRSKWLFDFNSYLEHSLFLKFLQQLFLKGKSFLISWETGSWKTTFLLSLYKYLNEHDVDEFKRRGYINLLKNSQIDVNEDMTYEQCISVMEKLISEHRMAWTIQMYDSAILANPIVPIIETMQNTFIYTLENPIEYNLADESNGIDFEQIETDDYSSHLTSTVTVNPNMVYVSELRTIEDYNNFLLVSAQWKQVVSTNHAENVFENIKKIIWYVGNESFVKQAIASWVWWFIHFKRYYPTWYYVQKENGGFELKEFGFTDEVIDGIVVKKKENIFLVSYEYLSFMDDEIRMMFQSEKDLEMFKTRVNNQYFYIPNDFSSKEEWRAVMLYFPHEVSLLYNMFNIYKKYRFIPKINVSWMNFWWPVRWALENAYLHQWQDKLLLVEFMSHFHNIYLSDNQ